MPDAVAPYQVEERLVGDARWVAIRARGAEWSYLTAEEAVDLGRQWVERRDGNHHMMTGTDQTELAPGDLFVIETPGGGGYGSPRG